VSQPKKLSSPGFLALLGVSFFGAANDNVLKQVLTFMVATGIWAGALGNGSQGIVGLCLTVPFILLSGFAGQISDKYSKRTVILWVKIAEVPIALVACAGLAMGNLWLSLGALLLMAIQSAFYGPAKFGVIPDLVEQQRLSQANGLINMLTNVAVILGSLAAGPISDFYAPPANVAPAGIAAADLVAANPVDPLAAAPVPLAQQPGVQPAALPPEQPVAAPAPSTLRKLTPGLALLCIALVGLFCCTFFPPQIARDPHLQFNYNPFHTYVQTFREMNSTLMTVMFSWSGFYMIGMMALLIIPEYQVILEIDYTHTSYLIGTMGVAIAVGSVAAGVLSGKQIRPYFIPFGAIGMTICFLLLGILKPTYANVAGLIFFIGFFAGFYIIPLQSLLQYLSPAGERGRFFGTANALSFVFSTFGSLAYWGITGGLGLPANRVPLVCAAIAMIGTTIGIVQLNRIMADQKLAKPVDDSDDATDTDSPK
jgi:MFS family permease